MPAQRLCRVAPYAFLLPPSVDAADPIEPDILDAGSDLHFRLEEARQRLLPDRSVLDRAEVRERMEEIIRSSFIGDRSPLRRWRGCGRFCGGRVGEGTGKRSFPMKENGMLGIVTDLEP
ncbi:hypothetical protein BJF91_21340 [Allorhizobium taibaishanense]|uniref:Uncharacterized protein n=1 Tax=Allorhizobium taibaishanense TaxID=887144 RepID=A0A1Q9A4U5_9HYPH|nr:hypothetical protein BJF91_21340 [Allorhizobium taibaishanense]